MNSKFFKASLVCLALSMSCFFNIATAGMITVTDTQFQTASGEDFDFSFNIIDWESNSASSLRITVLSDLNHSSESVEAYAEAFYGGLWNGTETGVTLLQLDGNLREFAFDINLNASQTNTYLADDYANVDVNFSSAVGNFVSGSYAKVEYTYKQVETVPEPSTLAIFALGMIGLASRRFKKQS